jgi:4-alpha-glucanotransferase
MESKFKELFGSDRLSGILLHPTSLPGKYGIGDLGSEVYKFLDFLHKYNQKLWQILPLGPTGYGNSPYACFSAFAGNILLISPEKLVEIGLLNEIDIVPPDKFLDNQIQYDKVREFKREILKQAYSNFKNNPSSSLITQFELFSETHSFWLEDYTIFMSIKDFYNFTTWIEWEESLRLRNVTSMNEWKIKHEDIINFYKFTEFIFFKQWEEVREYAKNKSVKIIGDIPIFVAYDSADVWANPDLFYLEEDGELKYVAGVPPDYFSRTGQRWGNPLYNWDKMKKNHYKWWIQRIKHNIKLVDILRIDHFRGFEAYWQIPATEETAINGTWIPGPGEHFFIELRKALGLVPIIAEDLGYITPEVESLLQATGFPGMNVLQFAFGTTDEYPMNRYLPHYYKANSITYTGTHDNQTTLSWFEDSDQRVKDHVLEYTNSDGTDIVGDLIRLAWASVSKMVIIPLQDLIRLRDEGRMNVPGTIFNGNWEFRFSQKALSEVRGKELAQLNQLYNR